MKHIEDIANVIRCGRVAIDMAWVEEQAHRRGLAGELQVVRDRIRDVEERERQPRLFPEA